ncbi:MAG: hypothetical protein D6721_07230 [Gammaproteobacteria bacterium]|nr:MAG: hypothetical protein D6721_07230 [Gammaproteobacteria bacterium]
MMIPKGGDAVPVEFRGSVFVSDVKAGSLPWSAAARWCPGKKDAGVDPDWDPLTPRRAGRAFPSPLTGEGQGEGGRTGRRIRFLPTVFCLLSPDFCLLPSAFCLLSSDFCLLTSVFRLPSSVFRLQTPDFCLLTSLSRIRFGTPKPGGAFPTPEKPGGLC